MIWFATGWGDYGWNPSFPWPLFVILGTGLNMLRVVLSRHDIIEEERRRLERKQRKALDKSKRDNGA